MGVAKPANEHLRLASWRYCTEQPFRSANLVRPRYARSTLEPRRWQREALKEWQPRRRGVVSVVTGAGKTAFALMAFEEARKADPNLRLVVVVPTIALLDQWVVALETDAGIRLDEIALFSGEGRAKRPSAANVLVINTAREMVASFADGVPTMLVVDECHRAGSSENARSLEIPAQWTLGLSATTFAQSSQRGGVAREVPGVRGGEPETPRSGVPLDRANADGECPLPVRGGR
jgi:superfamily II DNA or RNA helicase